MIRIELIGSAKGLYCVSRDWIILGWFESYEDADAFRKSLSKDHS